MEFLLEGSRVYAGTGGRDADPSEPAVVLLHGAGMDHTVFAAQARALAHHGRTVLAFDLPGHGRSDGPPRDRIAGLADWVLAAVAAAGVRRFRIAGHSMGALTALEVAARGGERVEGLALIGFAPEMRVHPDLLAAAREGEHAAVELMTGWSFALQGRLGASRTPGVFLPGSALRLLERADRRSLALDLAACDAYRGAADSAGKIRCPVLLLLGGADRMAPPARAQAFAPGFAESRVVVLPGAGHLLMIEEPAATLAGLRTVL
jgi:pimeloyl-ACP methyl ester carboxylesterase